MYGVVVLIVALTRTFLFSSEMILVLVTELDSAALRTASPAETIRWRLLRPELDFKGVVVFRYGQKCFC